MNQSYNMKIIKTFEEFRLTESLITEALSIKKAREYTSIERNPAIQSRLDSIFDQLAGLPGATTSKRGDRVYVPFSSSEEMIVHESPVKKEVETALKDTDFTLKDYKLGVVIDKFGREVKLGKVLNRIGRTDLVKLFNGDSQRESAKRKEFFMVFSKHPYDIAGMSSDRGWTSCMDIYSEQGVNVKYIKQDIKKGSFICYLIKPNDKNLSSPTARILIKPYINMEEKNDVVYSPDQIYGTAPDSFRTAVQEILSKVQGKKIGTFMLAQQVYCDNMDGTTPSSISMNTERSSKLDRYYEIADHLLSFGLERINCIINDDLTVDVEGSVSLSGLKLSKIPVKFGSVSGDFDCGKNQLTSLEGAPEKVGGGFNCGWNQLTSLEGAPKEVGEDFNCGSNQLTSLEGAPKEVSGDFKCSNNQLRSLQGAPEKVGGDFDCSHNPLSSLKGAPKRVNSFICQVKDLEYYQEIKKNPLVSDTYKLRLNRDRDREFSSLSQEDYAWAKNNIIANKYDFKLYIPK
jgi:hypothetical protein